MSIFENIGNGVLLPFRRDNKNDFANGSGSELVKSSLFGILGALCAGPNNNGELAYNQKYGTLLKTLRHRNFDEATEALAIKYIVEGIKENEKRVRITKINVDRRIKDRKFIIRLTYDIVSETSKDVIVQGEKLEAIT